MLKYTIQSRKQFPPVLMREENGQSKIVIRDMEVHEELNNLIQDIREAKEIIETHLSFQKQSLKAYEKTHEKLKRIYHRNTGKTDMHKDMEQVVERAEKWLETNGSK